MLSSIKTITLYMYSLLAIIFIAPLYIYTNQNQTNAQIKNAHYFNARHIIKIIIKGNKTTPKNAILQVVPYHIGEFFDKNKTRNAIKNIYKINRFNNVQLFAKNSGNDGIELHIHVTEKTPLKEINISGNSIVTDREIYKKIVFDDIHTITQGELKQYAQQIKEMYLDKGYHRTIIDTELRIDETDNNATAYFTITEGKKVTVKQIHFSGNHSINSKELRSIALTKEDWLLGFLDKSGTYHPEKNEADKHMLEQHYQNRGFMNARIVDVEKTIDEKTQRMKITFDIEEGDRYTIGSFSVPGNDILPEEFLRSQLPIYEGSYYSREKLSTCIKQLERIWGDHGYIFAHINPSVQPDKETKTVNIAFYSELGEQIKLRHITIKGNHKTRDKVIRRKFALREGGFITKRLMETSKRNVSSLGYFEPQDGVTWKILRRTQDTADLDLIVKEAKTGHFGAQLSFGGKDMSSPSSGVTMSLEFSEANLFGKGVNINAQAAWSQNDQNALLHIAQPWIFDKPLTVALDIYHKRPSYNQLRELTTRSISEKLTGGALSLGYITPPYLSIFSNSHLSTGFGIDSIRYENPAVAKDDIDGIYQNILNKEFTSDDFIWVSFNAEQDIRNHPIHTSRGHRLRFTSRVGIPTFNDCIGYYSANIDGHWYTPLIGERSLVFHLHGYAGYSTPLSGHSIPFASLYHIGGEATVRGFNYGDISPKFLSDTIGGKKAFFVNAELIFPISPDMSMKGLVFYDGGSGWDNPYLPSCPPNAVTGNNFDYRHSIGFGLRVLNPMPIRVDWGFKIDPREGESGHQVHFGTSLDW